LLGGGQIGIFISVAEKRILQEQAGAGKQGPAIKLEHRYQLPETSYYMLIQEEAF
jgi:hypothetical protein